MREEIRKKGYPPTVREICTALNIKSTSTVHSDIAALVQAGKLKKDATKPRALMVVDMGDTYGQGKELAPERDDVVDIPVIGNVAAGMPILAEENKEDSIPFPARYVQGSSFMLKVKGDSMVNVGILNGDLILVKQQHTAYNGQIVVAMVGDDIPEATVKTFYKEQGHIRLQPENDTMTPIIVPDCKIVGVVKGVYRTIS